MLTLGSMLAVVAVLALPCAYAQGSDGWSAPQVLGRGSFVAPEEEGGVPLVGNARGEAAVAWRTLKAIRLALAKSGRPFGASRLIGHRADRAPFVAMDQRGDVILAWSYEDEPATYPKDPLAEGTSCCDHVRVAMIRPGAHGAISYETLTPDTVSAKVRAVAISAGGSTVAVAYETAPRSVVLHDGSGPANLPWDLVVRVARFGGKFGRGADLGTEGKLLSLHAGSGRASVLYSEGNVGGLSEAHVSTAGMERGTRSLEGFGAILVGNYFSAYDARGDQAVLLSTPKAETLEFATRRPGGTFRVRTLTTERLSEFESSGLAVAPSGLVLVMWSVSDEGRTGLRVAVGRLPDGRLGSPVVYGLRLSNEQNESSACAIDSLGQAAIIETTVKLPNKASEETASVVGIFRSASGRFSKPVVLSGPRHVFDAANPEVVIGEHGQGVATWQGTDNELLARRFQVH